MLVIEYFLIVWDLFLFEIIKLGDKWVVINRWLILFLFKIDL